MGWQVFGHTKALLTVENLLRHNTVPHAYLITGDEHIGKTTLALDIARVLNCQENHTVVSKVWSPPCDTCSHCTRISRLKHANIRIFSIESLKALLPRTAGQARRKQIPLEAIQIIRKESQLKPFEGYYNVFIINQSELMSDAAANALLKTLEEPPEHVVIILTSSSEYALPETITSRCITINLHAVPVSLIRDNLISNHGVNQELAEVIARFARHRPGWAIDAITDPAMLEKCNQSAVRANQILLANTKERLDIAASMSARIRNSIEEVNDELDLWIWWWRDIAMIQAGHPHLIINLSIKDELTSLAQLLTLQNIHQTINAILKAQEALKANVSPRITMEVMVLDLPRVKLQSKQVLANVS